MKVLDFEGLKKLKSNILNKIPTKVSELTNDSGYTTNTGTITGITMNGTSKGTSGVVDLGTVITSHQDISGKADKVISATENNLASLDSEGNIIDSGIGTAVEITELENNPVTFETKFAQTARGLSMTFEPIQDLHGYDKPWVGGAGKNKLPMTVDGIKALNTAGSWSGNTFTTNGGTITVNTDSDGNFISLTINGTFSPTVLFNLSSNNGFDSAENVGRLLNGYPSNYTGSSATITFRFYGSGGDFNIYNDNGAIQNIGACTFVIRINNGYTANNLVFQPMIRLATETDPTFEPYSNICPIEGYTDAKVGVTGKNLLDSSSGVLRQYTADPTTLRWGYKPVTLQAGTYTVKYTKNSSFDLYLVYTDNWDSIDLSTNGTTLTISEEREIFIRSALSGGNTEEDFLSSFSDVQLELGSTATPYEPYQSNTATIDLDGTRYGFTVDFVTGELVVDRKFKMFDGSEDWNTSGNKGFAITRTNANINDVKIAGTKQTPMVSNMFPNGSNINVWTNGYIGIDNGTIWIGDTDFARFTDLSTFKSYLASNNLQIVYPLATPITVQLTPAQLELLRGYNNVSGNGKTIKIKFIEGYPVATMENIPTKVSELINDSGYITDAETVTQIKVGTTTYNPSSGVVSLPAYPSVPVTSVAGKTGAVTLTNSDVGLGNVGNFKAVSTVASQGLSTTEQSNARANIGAGTSSFSGSYNDLSNKPTIPAAANNGTLTIQKNGTNVQTFTANQSTNVTANITVPTGTAADKNYTTSVTQNSGDLVTSGAVWTAIDNLPEPMVFKGSLGTNGTITTLPTAAAANTGHTYKVITAGTYASQSAKIGDLFISDGSSWVYIPSADEPSGTVTSVAVSNGGGLSVSGSPITSSGTITISHADTSSQASVNNSGRTYIQDITLDTYGHVTGITSATETVVNTDTHRPIQVNGTEVLGNNTTALNLKAGSNVSLSNSSGTVTIAATDTTYSDATTSTHGLMSTTDKSKLDGIASGAEVNQNAFSNVVVGSTTIAADGKTDTLTLVAGSNITLTPDATDDKVTIAATQPSVGNGTLTIQKNGADVATFTANQSGNATANLTVAVNDTLTNQNLNSMKTPGFYSAGGGNSVTNKPSGVDAFGLEVIHSAGGDYFVQIIYPASTSIPYRRYCSSNTWSSWVKDVLTDTTYSVATQSANGLMSSTDKTKLDGIATGATANTGTVTKVTGGTGLNGGDITTTGTLSVKYGDSAGTACQGNDSRLSNSRTPTAHASTATTYGVGTTSNYGHVKIQSGNMNGTTNTDGIAAGLGHTHSNYLTGHQTIKQDGITGATINRFGTCGTAAATAAKTVSITTGTFSLEAGARVIVKFTNTNTANNPTLNVDNTGAKNIFFKGVNVGTSRFRKLLEGTVEFIYDGTQYHIVGNYIDDYTLDTTTVGSASGWSAGTAPSLTYSAKTVKSVKSWSAGSVPTLGTAIAADDITAWSAGSTPTLGTAIAADDITAWSAGTAATASISKGVLTINNGTAPSLSYTARSIPNVTSVGSVPSLSYTARSIPNVTGVGSVPSLTTEDIACDDITAWSAGTNPSLTVTSTTVATGDITFN